MQRDEFTALLAAESFDEVVTVAREANGGLEFTYLVGRKTSGDGAPSRQKAV